MKVWIDGSSKNSVGQIGVAFEDGTNLALGVGKATSNEAEYLALLTAVQFAADHAVPVLHVYSDSKLVVNQVNGTWKPSKHQHLKKIADEILEYKPLFSEFVLQYVPREENKLADALSKASLEEDTNECPQGTTRQENL